MKDNFKIMRKEKVLVPFLYFLIALYILLPSFFSPGIFVGGDWSVPYTKIQNKTNFEDGLSTWKTNFLVGKFETFNNPFFFNIFTHLFFSIGLNNSLVIKLQILLYFFLSGYGLYLLLKYFKISPKAAFLGGFVYQTSPFMFNFTVIGWQYMLLSMSLLPIFTIFYIQAIREGKIYKLLLCVFIFTLALANSTSIFWYSVIICSLIFTTLRDGKLFKKYLFYTFIFYTLTIFLNFHWLINLVIFREPKVFGSENVLSAASLGNWIHFEFENIIRGWGTIYNYSYESSYTEKLSIFSYLAFVIAIYGFVKFKSNEIISKYSFLLIVLFPIFLLILGPFNLAKIPFSNIIRDPGRNIVLLSFSTAIFIAAYFEYWQDKNKIVFTIGIIVIMVNAHPFILGKIYEDSELPANIKLRTYKYPSDYEDLEVYLRSINTTNKALYFPLKGNYNYSDPRFCKGPHSGFNSSFKMIPPIQGLLGSSEKEVELMNIFYRDITNGIYTDFSEVIEPLLNVLNIEYMIFYFDRMSWQDWYVHSLVEKSDLFENVTESSLGYESPRLALYRVREPVQEVHYAHSGNFIFTNEEEIYRYTKLTGLLNNYDLIYREDLGEHSNDVRIDFPEEYNSPNIYSSSAKEIFLPNDVTPPSDLITYRYLLARENLQSNNAKTYKDKFDLLMTFNSRRLSEIINYPDANVEISFKNYIDNYQKIKDLLSSVDNEKRDLVYVIELQRLFEHVNYADHIFRGEKFKVYQNISYEDGTSCTLSGDYLQWVKNQRYICNNTCYYFDRKIDDREVLSDKTNNYWKIDPNKVENTIGEEEIYEVVSDNYGIVTSKELKSISPIYLDDVNQNKEVRDLLSVVTHGLEGIRNIKNLNQLNTESLVKSSIKVDLLEDLNNIVMFEIEKLPPEEYFEIKISHLDSIDPILFVIVEEYADFNEEYRVGYKQENFELKKRLAFIDDIVTSSDETEASYKYVKKVKSNESTHKFYVLLINSYKNGNLFIDDFNLSKKEVPIIYSQENMNSLGRVGRVNADFDKISKTKYTIRLPKIENNKIIVLNQLYDEGWALYDPRGDEIEAEHYVANGYANSWLLDENQNFDYIEIRFKPDFYGNIGKIVSCTTCVVMVVYFFIKCGLYESVRLKKIEV